MNLGKLGASLLANVILLLLCGGLLVRGHYLPKLAQKDAAIAGLQGTLNTNAAVAQQQAKDNGELQSLRTQLATAGGQVRIVYRDRIKQLPPLPADCAPGGDRQAAINDLIHHPTTTGEKSK